VSKSLRIFNRLAGLETEYAVSLHPHSVREQEHEIVPTRWEVYERVVLSLSRKLPVVRAFHLKEGAFLATGGAVWFEADRLSGNGGLIEGSTPECRSPQELLAYQRAQDRLLEEAVEKASHDCGIKLLKNDRDAFNNIYGAQENYETNFASGFALHVWRLGLICLFPLMLLTWLATGLVFCGTIAYEYLAVGLLVPLGEIFFPSGIVARWLLGNDRVEQRPFGAPCPAWVERVLLLAYTTVSAPLALMIYSLIWLTGFRDIRRKLLPFFISRPILSGSGMLDGDSRFLIADKAPAITSVLGYGGFFPGRPLLLLGGFFKVLSLEALFSPQEYFDLFAPRQRLQIGLGDSNLCEAAEYLRVATTMLVLDCLEAGELPEPPRIRRPIQALRTVCTDTELTQEIPTSQGACTALRLQRFYCGACRRFLSQHASVPPEAWRVLRLWEQTLDALETDPRSLAGTLDWITKRFLLEHAPSDVSWETLKKIDLKYHELSPEGYFRVLSQATRGITKIVSEEEILRAMRLPPANTPATMRGRLIREFGAGDEFLAVNWKMVRIGRGGHARTFRLSDYQPEITTSHRSTKNETDAQQTFEDRDLESNDD
jgi:Pup amidohydrolase